MPRRRKAQSPASASPTPPPPPAVAPVVIPDDAIFRLDDLRAALGLARDTLRRAVRQGRLRVARINGRYFVRGAWIHEWLTGAEVTRYRGGAALNGTPPAAEREVKNATGGL
jgi:hypothetical protein